MGKIYVYEENWQEAINVLEPLTQNPYTYKLVEDFNWNLMTLMKQCRKYFELLIEDVGGTDLWGDGEISIPPNPIPALKNMPLLKSEDGMKQILPSKLWISSGRKRQRRQF